MRKKLIYLALILVIISLAGAEMYAQCPMCKIAAESNLENGGSAGKGLNTGILYMLALPYILIFTLGILWFRNKRQESEN